MKYLPDVTENLVIDDDYVLNHWIQRRLLIVCKKMLDSSYPVMKNVTIVTSNNDGYNKCKGANNNRFHEDSELES